ncbi:MAG: metal-dependent hydrolase [Acidobacteriia bacterium]|nr:metal-dependent hydrolase [Terriglobia bacterium]
MDPITHGITGALLGKGYFSERHGRLAVFAATLGSVFPDVDVFAEVASRDPLSIIKYHRSITHSFVALPFFAMLLAGLTRWIARRLGWQTPSWLVLTIAYGVGIASHIVLDGMTSFGTRMWFPLSRERVAWDLLFIIDFSFTSIVLLPQVGAWIYGDAAKSLARAIRMWVLFSLGAVLIWAAARGAGYPFHALTGVIACAVLAAVCFAPAAGGWGFRVKRAVWCQAGTYVAVAYLIACGLAHHAAITRAETFAEQNHLAVERIAALPIPPAFLDWGDAIRTPHGVYESQFDLRGAKSTGFYFIPDSPPDPFIARALQLPDVQLYWGFARFPSIQSFAEDGRHIVELGENRFSDGRHRSPQPFTYQVVFDTDGKLLAQGWLTSGLLRRQMRRVQSQQPGAAAITAPAGNAP